MNKNTTSHKDESRKANAFAFVLMIMLTLSVTNCRPKDRNGSSGSVGTQSFQTHTESTWNGSRITGTVKNMGDAKISFVAVEFDLLDDSRRTIRTVSAQNDRGIEPHGEWSFSIEASAAGARMTRLRNTVTR